MNKNMYKIASCMMMTAMTVGMLAGCGKEATYDYYEGTDFEYEGSAYAPKDMWIKLYSDNTVEFYLYDEANKGTYKLKDEDLTLKFDGGDTEIEAELDDDEITFKYADARWTFEEADEEDKDDNKSDDDDEDEGESKKSKKSKSSDGEVLSKLKDIHEEAESMGIVFDGSEIDVESIYKDYLEDDD